MTDVQRAMTGRRLALTTVATMLVRLLDARKLTREEVADLQRLVRNKARR